MEIGDEDHQIAVLAVLAGHRQQFGDFRLRKGLHRGGLGGLDNTP